MVTRATSIMPGRVERAQSMPDSNSVWGRRSSILPSLSWKKTSEVHITLDGEQEFIHSYSTFDEITGRVHLKFEKDTLIDDFAICLQGQTNTWVEKVATTSPALGKTTGKHTFLRVQQPIDHDCLPEDNKALAGVTYSVPFKFVVPERILDFTCNHKVNHPSVKECHLQLPPSIGDPMLAGQGNTLMDDLAPKMSKISYAIRVGLVKAGHKPEQVSEEVGIRILPAREESPPLEIDPSNMGRGNKYSLRKEKTVRKGILKVGKKQGCLTAEAFQPASLKLSHPTQHKNEPVTTVATVNLRYDPASAEEQPPPLNCITSRLRVYTFFGASPWAYNPVPDGVDIYSTLHAQYPETVCLSTRNLSNVEWVRHQPGMSRRASVLTTTTISSSSSTATSSSSAINMATIPAPSMSYDASLPYYTSTVVVPITLPTTNSSNSSVTETNSANTKPKKSNNSKPITFLPTFHSCLISRIYVLEMSLAATSAPTMNLRVPIQLSLPHTRTPISSPLPTFASIFPNSVDHTNPFSRATEETSDEVDPEDEALAQALDSAHFRNSDRRFLDDVPEYEVTPTQVNRHTSTATASPRLPQDTNMGRNTRHMSLLPTTNTTANTNPPPPPPPSRPTDLPPTYDTATRRMPRQQRRNTNNSASTSLSTPASMDLNSTSYYLADPWCGSGNDGSRPLVVRYVTGAD